MDGSIRHKAPHIGPHVAIVGAHRNPMARAGGASVDVSGRTDREDSPAVDTRALMLGARGQRAG